MGEVVYTSTPVGGVRQRGQSHLTAHRSYLCVMWFLSAVISGLNMSQSRSQSVTSLKRSSGC